MNQFETRPVRNADLLEEAGHIDLVLLIVQFRLDFRERIVDDGEEHVQEDEEDEEDIEDEVGWTEDVVWLLKSLEVEISENDTEQGEADGNKMQFTALNSSIRVVY